ncbi:MAG: hypothetical protein E6Q98_26905 [Rhodospirillaceae bacterium]|nr:MAG: hypothetical protein E6Q98_26905 [Rhodospirillaceae bacterium]
MGGVGETGASRFAKFKQAVARLLSRPRRLLGDLWFSVLFVLAIAGLLLAAVIAVILAPVTVVFWAVVRLCYWLAGRAAMWYRPDGAGRLHRWPWLVNLLLFAAIFALVFRGGLPLILWSLGKYLGWLVDLSWPVSGYLITPLVASCNNGDCEKTVIAWLSSNDATAHLWFGWIAAALLAAATIFVFRRVTGEAKRLSMLEAGN